MEPEDEMPEQRIGELLYSAELITREDLAEALELQATSSERIVNILMTMGALDSEEFLEFLAGPDSYPKIYLEPFEIKPEIIGLVPRAIAEAHEVIPVDKMGSVLTLGMVCPLDLETIKMLEAETGLEVRPFICCRADFRACFERYYLKPTNESSLMTLGGSLKLTTAVTMLRHIDSLPALPGTVLKVREILLKDSGGASEVGEVISRDPAIAAKMLKVANSPAYGFMQRVDTVELAVSLLGLLETYSVVMTSAVIDLLSGNKNFNYADFWMESMVCAKLSKAIAQLARVNDPGIVTAGLLHDIGRIAFVQLVPEHYSKVDQQLLGPELVSAEEVQLGLTHTEAGYQLAQHWDFPQGLAECIRYHHMPEYASPEHQKSVAVVNIADMIARSHRFTSQNRIPDLGACASSLASLGIIEADVIDLFDVIPESDSEDTLL